MRHMETLAPRLCTSAPEIERIEQLTTQLASSARVRVTLHDGTLVKGTVVERPVVQLFKDADGNEGFNGVVRLEDPDVPLWTVYLWLADIDSIEQLDIP